LGLFINTVHKHLRSIADKFGVHSTFQIIAVALQKGFIRWKDEPTTKPKSRSKYQEKRPLISNRGALVGTEK